MSQEELFVLKDWVQDDMSKEFIRQSSSPFEAADLFEKEPDVGL